MTFPTSILRPDRLFLANTWPISAVLMAVYLWITGKRVKARRGIEIERNPLREIEWRVEEEWARESLEEFQR